MNWFDKMFGYLNTNFYTRAGTVILVLVALLSIGFILFFGKGGA